jgi:hypothetical protein
MHTLKRYHDLIVHSHVRSEVKPTDAAEPMSTAAMPESACKHMKVSTQASLDIRNATTCLQHSASDADRIESALQEQTASLT